MREETGDIWEHSRDGWIVVPMHLVVLDDRKAVFSTGVSAQALQKHPSLERVAYGLLVDTAQRPILHCVCSWDLTYWTRLILFPTRESPRARGNLEMIRKNLRTLPQLPITGPIYLPLLGCGYGRLDSRDVEPLMREILTDDRYVLVRRGPGVVAKYPRSFRVASDSSQARRWTDRSLEREQQEVR